MWDYFNAEAQKIAEMRVENKNCFGIFLNCGKC